ncbi:MAG: hypothetical protein ACFFBD_15185, partial [Candidatus Hodarchaeota archaeon]
MALVERVVHVELPFTANVVCEVRHLGREGWWTLSFLKDNQVTYSAQLRNPENEEDVMEILISANIDFTSFSAIDTVTTKIWDIMENFEKYNPKDAVEEEKGVIAASRFDSDDDRTVDEELKSLLESDQIEAEAVASRASVGTTPQPQKKVDKPKPKVSVGASLKNTPAKFVHEFEMPYSNGTHAEIGFDENKKEWYLGFVQEGTLLKDAIRVYKTDEDTLVDILTSANIEFQSFSAIYTIAADILRIFKKPGKYGIEIKVEEEKLITADEVEEEREKAILDEMRKEMRIEKRKTDEIPEEKPLEQLDFEEEIPAEKHVPVTEDEVFDEDWRSLPATKIYEFELPYTAGARAALFRRQFETGAYHWTMELKPDENSDFQYEAPLSKINEDAIVDILVEVKIEFQSFSAVYEVADKVLDVINNTGKYYREPEEEDAEEADAVAAAVETMPEIDLASLRGKEDIDRYIELLKKSMDQATPVLVREIEVKGGAGTICQIYRKGKDEWLLGFYSLTDSSSKTKPRPLESLEVDAVAKLVNLGIAQMSFTALYDAAEALLRVIDKLKERPEDELVVNQAVNHFTNVIKDHEANNDLDKAMDVARALLEKFRQFDNPSGIMQFGLKVADYYERQQKVREGAKLRFEILEELIATKDVGLVKEYVDTCIKNFEAENNELDIARVAFRFADMLLSDEEPNVEEGLVYVGRGIEIYQRTNLPLALSENTIKYGHLLLHAAKGDDASSLSEELLENVYARVSEYFQIALQIYESRDDQEELLELMENVVTWLAQYDCPENLIVEFSEKAIRYYEKAGEYNRILAISLNLSERLMNTSTYRRALEFVGKAVQLYYNFQHYEEVVKLGLVTIDRLLDIVQEELAIQYIVFVNQVLDSVFKDNPEISFKYKAECAKRLVKIEREEERALLQIKQAVQKAIEGEMHALALEITETYTKEFIEGKKLKLAQQLINDLILIAGHAGQVPVAAQIARIFANLTFEKGFYDLSTEYIKYSSSLYQTAQDTETAIQIFIDYIPQFVDSNRVQNAELLITPVLEHYWAEKMFDEGTELISTFIERMINNEIYDRVYAYSVQNARFYQANEEHEEGENTLLKFRDLLVEQGKLAEATELTNMAVQTILGRSKDYRRAIDALEPHVEQLVRAKKFEDAYVYAVQTVKYYEELDALEEATEFLKGYRNIVFDLNILEDAEKITKLIIHRLGESDHKDEAIEISKEFATILVEKGHFDLGAKYTIITTQLQQEIGQIEEGIELLDELFPILLKEKPEELPNVVVRKSRMYHALGDIDKTVGAYIDSSSSLVEAGKPKAANPLVTYVIDYIKSWDKQRALETARDYTTRLNKHNYLGDYLLFLEKTIDLMIEVGDELGADTYANNYVEEFLDKNDLVSAKETVEKLISLANNDLRQITKIASRFARQLVEREHLGIAREYTDRVVSMALPADVPEPGAEALLIAAQMTEDFFVLIKDRSPEIAREYAFRGGTYYEKVRNWAGVVRVYKGLVDVSSDNKKAIKVLRRALRLCSASGVKSQEA